ncbi:MAG: hypothetical protein KatS3mg068_1626 [Candidatus Sericytochromatia bacterium]|nr:MAG: hypothetical protein KatS3mg068_1626 [Candidatus Sericytochromatia bacterium]
MALNKKKLLLLGIGFLTSFISLNFLKRKFSLNPKLPPVDDNTVLLIQYKYSPFCLKVSKVMDYKGIPYKTLNLLPLVNKNFIKNISGQELLPVIKHKGNIIYDSTEIAKYLDNIYPEPSIYIKDNEDLNNEVLLLEDWADEIFEPLFGKLALMYLLEHPEFINEIEDYNLDIDFIDKNKDKLAPFIVKSMLKNQNTKLEDKTNIKIKARECLSLVKTKIKNKNFLVGDRLTIADITLASHLSVAKKVPYIAEDDNYQEIFKWQENIFNLTKRKYAIVNN